MSTMILSPIATPTSSRMSRKMSFVRPRLHHSHTYNHPIQYNQSRLDHDIARLQILLEQLVRSRDERKDALISTQALTSAFLRIPPEIFQEVFSYCHSETAGLDESSGPLLLAHVSSSWRRIVFGTSSMWSSLAVTVPKKENGRLEAMVEWLRRSKQQPLTLTVHVPAGAADATPYLQTLVDHSVRWRNVTLSLPSHYLSSLGGLTSSTVPMLRSFGINDSFHGMEGTHSHQSFTNELWEKNLSFLQDSGITSLSFSRKRGLVHLPALPLSTLESLSISAEDHLFLNIDAYIHLLSQTSNLRSFSLDIADWEYAPTAPVAEEPVSLKSIQDFTVNVSAYPSASLSTAGILERISLPNAKRIELGNGGKANSRVDAELLRSLDDLLRRSEAKELKTVALRGVSGEVQLQSAVEVERL